MNTKNTTETTETNAREVVIDGVEVIDNPNTVALDTPIKRGNQEITEVTLRKPTSGELRGTKLSDLISLDVIALQKVLPRISSPTLTENDVAMMDPADLCQLGGVFVSFLYSKRLNASLDSLNA